MSKKIIIGIFVVMFLFYANIANAKQYRVSFKNLSKEKVSYFLYRIDHNIKHIPRPIAFVCGTLRPGDSWSTLRDANGHFYLEWKSENEKIIMELEPFYLNKDISFTYYQYEGLKIDD